MNNEQASLLKSIHHMLMNLKPEYKFDINFWVQPTKEIQTTKERVSCGTPCCAVGWAIQLLPDWKAKFDLLDVHYTNPYTNPYINHYTCSIIENGGGDVLTIRAIANILGTSLDEFKDMFVANPYDITPQYPTTPIDVAEKVEKVLNNYDYSI